MTSKILLLGAAAMLSLAACQRAPETSGQPPLDPRTPPAAEPATPTEPAMPPPAMTPPPSPPTGEANTAPDAALGGVPEQPQPGTELPPPPPQ